jgi:hypothetical protein
MRIDASAVLMRPVKLLASALVIGGVVVGLYLALDFRSQTATSHVGGVPAGAAARGVMTTAITTAAKVTLNEALAAVKGEYGDSFDRAKVDAYLVHATDDTTMVRDADVWLLDITGLSMDVPGPMGPDGKPTYSGTLTEAYVYVDANTGEWLVSKFYEY